MSYTREDLLSIRDSPSKLERKVKKGRFEEAVDELIDMHPYTNETTLLRLVEFWVKEWFAFTLILDSGVKELENMRKFIDYFKDLVDAE